MRPLPLSQFSNRVGKATRVAIAVGAIAGLAVLAACADDDVGKRIVGPPDVASPRSATIGPPFIGFGGVVQLCVDASSPAGTYQFVNTEFLSGFENGGTGITVPNVAVGTPYTIPVGGCVFPEVRVKPDVTFPQFADTWSGITVQPFSIPASAVYDSSNCIEDPGVKHTDPTPCGTGNFSTRAFMNIRRGTQLVYFFTPAQQVIPTPLFVIGDVEPHGAGVNVNWWGSQWWKNNFMSGTVSSGVASFKGYASSADNFCGGNWISRVGNSPPPAKSVGPTVAIIVTKDVLKIGPDIGATIQQILLVVNDGGYGPNPGHDGNGPVLKVLCTL